MKNIININSLLVMTLSLSFLLISACTSDDDSTEKDIPTSTLEKTDQDALLFMLEEEKLARDTYIFLGDLWSINQFNNIQKSEQTHMNAVENLLKQSNTSYTILPLGEFINQELQSLYDQFIVDGATSEASALQIGATIEDLDIVDLQVYTNESSNTDLILVFDSLQCGSRNHLRSFVVSIENNGNTYIPQYLSRDDYNTIINDSREQCN